MYLYLCHSVHDVRSSSCKVNPQLTVHCHKCFTVERRGGWKHIHSSNKNSQGLDSALTEFNLEQIPSVNAFEIFIILYGGFRVLYACDSYVCASVLRIRFHLYNKAYIFSQVVLNKFVN